MQLNWQAQVKSPRMLLTKNTKVTWLTGTHLGRRPSKITRFPSICIWTLTRSVGLAMNCPKAPALIPAITDFLGIKDLRSDQMLLSRALFNPLHSDISRCILHTVLHTFPEKLTRRICFTIKNFLSWLSFLWFSYY